MKAVEVNKVIRSYAALFNLVQQLLAGNGWVDICTSHLFSRLGDLWKFYSNRYPAGAVAPAVL